MRSTQPRILLTGAGGQLGGEVVLRAQQRNLVALNRQQLDICDREAIAQAFEDYQPDIIINAAAYTAVDRAESEPEIAHAVNAEACERLAEAAKAAGIPVLHISTDYVFDGDSTSPYQPDDAPNPQSVYGESKLAGEQLLRNGLEHHLILRVSWVFGALGNNFVKTMLRLANTQSQLRIVGDQHGAPTHAGAIADLLLVLCDRYFDSGQLPWGTWHFSGTPQTTWFEFAQRIFEQARSLQLITQIPELQCITTADYPTPAKRPQHSALDLSQSEAALQFKAPDWNLGLTEMLQALAKAPD